MRFMASVCIVGALLLFTCTSGESVYQATIDNMDHFWKFYDVIQKNYSLFTVELHCDLVFSKTDRTMTLPLGTLTSDTTQ